jgi:Ca2+-binding RTX toxin-like protein
MVGGPGADSFDGGAGEDQVSYADETTGVTIDLGAGAASGAATGDSFTAVENLHGTGHADSLTGDASDNRLYGAGGNDTLNGAGGVDRIYGGSGDDTINGGTGNDWLVGGAGADTFVFDTNWGADRIADFENGTDLVDLTATGLGYGDLTITQSGADTLIADGAGNTITLVATLATLIDAADFI